MLPPTTEFINGSSKLYKPLEDALSPVPQSFLDTVQPGGHGGYEEAATQNTGRVSHLGEATAPHL